jgi:hypothetical protein
MLLVHAGESRVQKTEENLYVSSLLIPAAAPTDSGLYVCLATNAAGGFNYKSASLSIVTTAAAPALTPAAAAPLPPLVLYVVGGLACLVLVLLTLLVSCILRSRHRLQLSDCRSQTTLVYQTHSPASFYNKTADGGRPPTAGSLNTGGGNGSLYKGNIYDIPYAHTKYTPVSLSDSASDQNSPGFFRPPLTDVGGPPRSPSILMSERPVRRVHELQQLCGGGRAAAGGSLDAPRTGGGHLSASSRQSSCANSPRSNPKRIVTINHQRNIQYSTQQQYPDL